MIKWAMGGAKQLGGFMLLETLVAISLFAIAMTTIAMILVPFFAGNNQNQYRPQMERLQMEALAHAMDKDAGMYFPVFAYAGELRRSNSWVTPGAVTYYQTNKKVYDLESASDFTNAVHTNSDTWTLTANSTTNIAYTLIFLGEKGNIEVVYRLKTQNVPVEVVTDGVTNTNTNISYLVERFGQLTVDTNSNTVYGSTHRVYFEAPNFTLSAPDQDTPYFGNVGNGVIRVLLPNPFSKRTINPFSGASVYKTTTPLQFDLKMKGS